MHITRFTSYLLVLLLVSTSALAKPASKTDGAPTFKTGVYAVEGSVAMAPESVYHGQLFVLKNGDNYRVIWIIGNVQAFVGVGIMDGSTFSVSYHELGTKESGVVSYQLKGEGVLEGKWSFLNSSTTGTEKLQFLSDSLATDLPNPN